MSLHVHVACSSCTVQLAYVTNVGLGGVEELAENDCVDLAQAPLHRPLWWFYTYSRSHRKVPVPFALHREW